MTTELQQRIMDAVREWMVERAPRDVAEKALSAAAARMWPDDIQTKETCRCGDPECDECPTAVQVEAQIARWESESAAHIKRSSDS
jgi:hypothetical protein